MTSPKKYHCCVPGCKTYDTLSKFVALPYESYWREQWLYKIPRKDWVVDASTIACKKHFQQPIETSTKSIKDEKDKTILTFVSTTSVPTVLANFNHNQAANNHYYPQTMFELHHRDMQGPKTLVRMGNGNTDFIGAYLFLKMMYPARLQMFLENNWKVIANMDYTIFYTTDFSDTPRIPSSIKVDKDLCVSVTLAGKNMDPLDLTWILPISGRLNRWSQLQMMLAIFGR